MLTKLFTWKYINLAALVLFIGFTAFVRVKENRITDDTCMQFASAQAWRQGYGLSLLYADRLDLAKVAPRPIEFWPPGYAVFAGSFLQLTGDIRLAFLAVDILGIVLFFTGWYLMSRRLIPFTVPFFPALLMLPWAFGYLFKWMPTLDLVALGWYVLGMACLLEWIARPGEGRRVAWLAGCMAGICGAFLFRFAYYPLAFMPAGILLAGAWLGNRGWWRPAFGVMACTAALVSAQVLYHHFITGTSNYLSQRHQTQGVTIHWYNLKQFVPFVDLSVPGFTRLPVPHALSSILLLLVLLVGSAVAVRSARRLAEPARRVVYAWFAMSWVAFLLNVAFMVFLSLRYPPEAWGPWTYVQETRYFSLNMAIVSSILLFLLFWKDRPASPYVRYAFYGLAIFIYVHAYAFAPFKNWLNKPVAVSQPLATAAVVQQLVHSNPGPVVFASDQIHDYWVNAPMNMIGMYVAMGGAALTHIDTLVKSYACTKPVTVLVAIAGTPPPGLETLYREGNARQVGTIGGGIPLMQLSLPPTRGQAAVQKP